MNPSNVAAVTVPALLIREAILRARNPSGKNPRAGRRVKVEAEGSRGGTTLTRRPATHNHACDSRARHPATAAMRAAFARTFAVHPRPFRGLKSLPPGRSKACPVKNGRLRQQPATHHQAPDLRPRFHATADWLRTICVRCRCLSIDAAICAACSWTRTNRARGRCRVPGLFVALAVN